MKTYLELRNSYKNFYQKLALGFLMIFVGLACWSFLEFLQVSQWLSLNLVLIEVLVLLLFLGSAVAFFLSAADSKTIISDDLIELSALDRQKIKAYSLRARGWYYRRLVIGLGLALLVSVLFWLFRQHLIQLHFMLLALSIYWLVIGLVTAFIIEAYGHWQSYQRLIDKPIKKPNLSWYWWLVLIVYLRWSWLSWQWQWTWLVWPIALIVAVFLEKLAK